MGTLIKNGINYSGLSINLIYPVGSIYMSVNNVNPGTYLTGTTWVAWGAGKVPVGVDTTDTDFDTVEETGGTKSVTLTAAQSGVPEHKHDTPHSNCMFNKSKVGGTSYGLTANSAFNGDVIVAQNTGSRTSGDAQPLYNDPKTNNNTAQNASQAHTNLQPYITCYMWKRTA